MNTTNESVRILVRGRIDPTPDEAVQEHSVAAASARRSPLIDIHEEADALFLEAEMPGAAEETVTIEIDRNVLSMFARSSFKTPPASEFRLLHQEFPDGDFARSFILSDEIERERITAEFRHGVLKLRLPKASRHTTSASRSRVERTATRAGTRRNRFPRMHGGKVFRELSF